MATDQIPIYTMQEFAEKLKRDGGAEEFALIVEVRREEQRGRPCIVVYHVRENGDAYGLIIDRQYAKDLTAMVGPHPMVEEFFNLH